MKLYDKYIDECRDILNGTPELANYKSYGIIENCNWNKLQRGCLVLENDTAVELGHPSKESLSLLMLTSDCEKINKDGVTVIGRELNEIKNSPVSFAKIILIEIEDIAEEQEAFNKFREIEQIRHTINLEGYMLRAAFQKSREWSRVSDKALKEGFSFQLYGSELLKAYKALGYVKKAEIVFITENDSLIRSLMPMGEKTVQITKALNKIFENLEFDCDACSFQNVCDEIDGLKEMHKSGARSK